MCVASPALPGPGQTLHEVVANASTLFPQFLVSVERLVAGLALGALIGAPLGLVTGMCPRVDKLVAPVLYILYPIPKIVFLPLLFVFFGLGGEAKVLLIVIAVVFQIMVTMRDAARQVPQATIDAMRSLGGNGWLVFMHVIVPATVPYFFSGLRVITGTAVAILFIAESMAGSTGLGYYIMHSWSPLIAPHPPQPPALMAARNTASGFPLLEQVPAHERVAPPALPTHQFRLLSHLGRHWLQALMPQKQAWWYYLARLHTHPSSAPAQAHHPQPALRVQVH